MREGQLSFLDCGVNYINECFGIVNTYTIPRICVYIISVMLSLCFHLAVFAEKFREVDDLLMTPSLMILMTGVQ